MTTVTTTTTTTTTTSSDIDIGSNKVSKLAPLPSPRYRYRSGTRRPSSYAEPDEGDADPRSHPNANASTSASISHQSHSHTHSLHSSSTPSSAARAQQYQHHHRRSSSSSSTAEATAPAVACYSRHLQAQQHHQSHQSHQSHHHVSRGAAAAASHSTEQANNNAPSRRAHHRHHTTSSSTASHTIPEYPSDEDENTPLALIAASSAYRHQPRARRPVSLPPSSATATPKPNSIPKDYRHHEPQLDSRASFDRSRDNRRSCDMAPSASANNGSPSTHHNEGGHSSKPSRSRTTIPTQSGKWILGKTIGAGSMGKVKLARKEDGSEQVACKIIPRGSPDDGHQSKADKERADQSKEIRTAREAAIVTLLNHPHICGLRDVVRTNYHWYMLFEYVNGGQMLDYIISHGKLKEKQARKFSRQIASALDYCHRNSIVHRDLKIENILISKTGDIKIIDFGLSNLFAPRGHLKTFCGSLYFAAPELLQARAYTGPEVDVWSFGIVLYVLVCGKVPFDDQSMPALHAKIKKGVVDYPSWLSSECKHLMSRMLVTDPKQRATMQEVMCHPWMVKGFSGPPENYLPQREPLHGGLEPEVVHAMQGFNFGSPESINAQLSKILDSDEYQRALRMYQRERDLPQPSKDGEKKRGFGFDFYKRRNSGNSRDTLTAPSLEALQLGNDPLNAFSPLLSIYYLVKEKQDKERVDNVPAQSLPIREKEKEKERDREREKDRDRDHRDHRDPRDHHERTKSQEGLRGKHAAEPIPDLPPPPQAYTNSAAYEMPGEKPTGGRTRPRARTHGEDDMPESAKHAAATQPEPKERLEPAPKKESGAAGLLRRFSTRKHKATPERLDKDRSHPPVVQVHSPAGSQNTSQNPITPRKSFSIRRRGRDREEEYSSRHQSGSSQPQHSGLLSPPATAGGSSRESRRSNGGLGRSTSVNSGDMRRSKSSRAPKDLPATSGSEQSMGDAQPSGPPKSGLGHSKSVATRARSLGHARRESIQQRRMRREAAHEANVPEETDAEPEASGPSTERLDKEDLAKPVFLKGLFSVSTTSGKSVPAIRSDIKRVLRQLNVDYVEIKGGFTCKHMPSIDLNKVQDPPASPGPPSAGGGHRRRFSFGGLMRGDERGDEVRDPAERPPQTPRTPGKDRDRSYSNSETSVDSIPRRTNGGSSRRAPGETSTQVQSDLGGSMVLEFEIFIVKVPLLTLHGIQFKRLEGNTWQYKNMADQILRELRL